MIRSLVVFLILILGFDTKVEGQCFIPDIGVNRTGLSFARLAISPAAAEMVAGGTDSIKRGGDLWNNADCAQEAHWVRPFPLFSTTQGSPTIDVIRETRLSREIAGKDSCASLTYSSSGAHDSAILRLYTHIKTESGVKYECNWDSPTRVELIVAHELGHYLGLGETHCQGSIMGGWDVDFDNSTLMATYLEAGHAIRDYECEKADDLSISPSEDEWEDQQCQFDPNCDPYSPCYLDPGCTCPIILDLDRDQFHLAGLDELVSFDIDADGALESITWTRGGSLDSFLCWDRNHDGVINDGSELFGNSTVLMDGSRAPFGYIALAELDQLAAGGNSDGFIDTDDQVYGELCVWTDLDHDGETDPNELRSLEEAGVAALEVESRTYPRRDSAGNLLLYTASAWIESATGTGVKKIATTDVFFVEVESDN